MELSYNTTQYNDPNISSDVCYSMHTHHTMVYYDIEKDSYIPVCWCDGKNSSGGKTSKRNAVLIGRIYKCSGVEGKLCNYSISVDALKYLVKYSKAFIGGTLKPNGGVIECEVPVCILENDKGRKCYTCNIVCSTNAQWESTYMKIKAACPCRGFKNAWSCDLMGIPGNAKIFDIDAYQKFVESSLRQNSKKATGAGANGVTVDAEITIPF